MRIGPFNAALFALAVSLPSDLACTQDGAAQTEATGSVTIVRDDTASVARFLGAVRGTNPVLCELATRAVDRRGGWWDGDGSSDALEMDSTSAALIAWAQHKHSDPAIVAPLRTALRDPDACVRRVAGSLLGRVEHPSAVTALVAALDDASADTRQAAAIGLGLSNKEGRPIEPLLQRLRDESPLVRRSVAWALGALEVKQAMNPLIELLQRDADPRVRQSAAWALGQVSK